MLLNHGSGAVKTERNELGTGKLQLPNPIDASRNGVLTQEVVAAREESTCNLSVNHLPLNKHCAEHVWRISCM